MPILDYFPLAAPRAKQVKALDYVERAVVNGYRDIVLELPTGIGKSACAATVCRWADSLDPSNPLLAGKTQLAKGGYVLVLQKVLQDQLAADLAKFSAGGSTARMIKSAVEYLCPNYKRCNVGMQKKCDCLKTGSCSYRAAKAEFLHATTAVTNYAYFMTERQHVGDLVPRRVIALDECSHINAVVTSQVGIAVSREALAEYAPSIDEVELGTITNLSLFSDWLKGRYAPAVLERAKILLELADSDEKAIQQAFDVEQHGHRADQAAGRIKTGQGEGWVFWRDESREDLVLRAKPLMAGEYFDELFGDFPIRVYLSAFPGAKGTFCRELGLDPSKVAWLRVGSTFDPAKRPVYLTTVGSLSLRNQAENMPAAMKVLRRILDTHAERGLIHTHSYTMADAVVEALRGSPHAARLRVPKSAEERNEALRQHAVTPGSILVSPSIYEGFSFNDELARWQILVKCPYPSLGDKHVQVRQERDPTWYGIEAVKAVLQACGRGMRHEQDYCETFVLDEDVGKLLKEYKDVIPKWFLDAIVQH